MALYPFSAAGAGELSIAEGDHIELLERVDADWLKGRLGGSEGIFPAGFVNVVVDLPPAAAAATEPKAVGGTKSPTTKSPIGMNTRFYCVHLTYSSFCCALLGHMSTALYDFDGNEGELSFKVKSKLCLLLSVLS